MAALSLELLGGHFLTVQRVAQGDGHRQRLGGIALVADVRAVGVPDEISVFLGPGLIAAHIFDVGQAAHVGKLRLAVAVVETLADDDVVDGAVGVRQHVDHFLFIHLGQRAGQHAGQQQGQRDDRGKKLLHNQFSSLTVLTFIPSVVWRIRPSHSISSAGRISSTHSMEMMAPRAISMHMELMMSISE